MYSRRGMGLDSVSFLASITSLFSERIILARMGRRGYGRHALVGD
jgi:hypothetical protein